MTQCYEEIQDILGRSDQIAKRGPDVTLNADTGRWEVVRQIIGSERVTLGPQASQQYLHAPEHLMMVLARYRAAAALIGSAPTVLEIGCGEGIGAGILATGREHYTGIDLDQESIFIASASAAVPIPSMLFLQADVFRHDVSPHVFDAATSLDVIEHIPSDREDDFLRACADRLTPHGVCVIGTPNQAFEHLASPQSKAGHINLYTHDRLHALMSRHFKVVQSFGMQDTSLHLGHPDARHYLLFCGIGPR